MPQQKPWEIYQEQQKQKPWEMYASSQPKAEAQSLIESRAAADRALAQAPESTAMSRVRNIVRGGVAGTGIDTNQGVMGNIGNILSGIKDTAGALVIDPLMGRGTKRGQEVIGGIAEGVAAGPREIIQGIQEGDYDKMAHGSGRTITGTLPAIYGGVRGVQSGVSAVRNSPRARTAVVTKIERNLAPSGREAQANAIRVAPKLAKYPDLVGVSPEVFEQRVYAHFKNADAAVKAAERTIPKGTVVSKAPILEELDNAIAKLSIEAESTTQRVPVVTPGKGVTGLREETVRQTVSGHPDALSVLTKSRADIAKLPEQVPFEDLLKYRRQLDDSIRTSGGWKDTATAAERATMEARRKVSNSIRGQLATKSDPLKAANSQFSIFAEAMEAAGLDWETGRKIGRVGKAPKPGMGRVVAEKVAKGAATATGLGMGYELWRSLKD